MNTMPLLVFTITLGCASYDAVAESSAPRAEAPDVADDENADDEPVGEPSQGSCPGFREPSIDARARERRLAFLEPRTAVMDANDPALGESLLWMAELRLLGGEQAKACQALERLTADVSDGEFAETGRCWYDEHCVASTRVHCPTGFTAEGVGGCEPTAECAIDRDGDIGAHVAGACDRGDAACCPKEGQLHQVLSISAKKAGDQTEHAVEEKKMRSAYEKACAQGHASLCAFVGEIERACSLGHRASCDR
jgi:hypothetical protein